MTSEGRPYWQLITIPDFVDQVNVAFRRVSGGAEVRLLKGEKTPSGDMHVLLSVGERYGHVVWWEVASAPISLSARYGDEESPVSLYAQEDRIEHRSYQGEFAFSLLMIEQEPEAALVIADTLLSFLRESEALDRAERIYNDLPPVLQEAIGYFVDEPVKRLDFTQVRDCMDFYTYQELSEEGLVRAERTFFGMEGRATVTDKGYSVLRYLAMKRKRQAKRDDKERGN